MLNGKQSKTGTGNGLGVYSTYRNVLQASQPSDEDNCSWQYLVVIAHDDIIIIQHGMKMMSSCTLESGDK